MNAYPANALEGAALSSPQRASYSRLEHLRSRHIDHVAEFASEHAEITGSWARPVECDALIVGNTNALSGSAELLLGGAAVFAAGFEIAGRITIVPLGLKLAIDGMRVTLDGSERLHAGLLWVGEAMALPRFLVRPEHGHELRGEGGRTFSGQARGVPAETLRTFRAAYARVPGAEARAAIAYADGVQNAVPHVIDPYPEARAEFPPMFATLAEFGGMSKRAENGFFWDFEMAWQEAR